MHFDRKKFYISFLYLIVTNCRSNLEIMVDNSNILVSNYWKNRRFAQKNKNETTNLEMPLYKSVFSHLEYYVQLWPSHLNYRCCKTGRDKKKIAIKVIRVLKQHPWERAIAPRIFQLERWGWKDMVEDASNIINYMKLWLGIFSFLFLSQG